MKTNPTPAGFWIRTIAAMHDSMLSFPLYIGYAYFLISNSSTLQALVHNFITSFALFMLPILTLSGFLYLPYFTSKFGGPLGKLLIGLKVTDNYGNLLTLPKSFFRAFVGYTFASAPLGYGFISAGRHPEKKGWHDQASGSKVINIGNRWWLGLLAIVVYLFASVWLGTKAYNSYNNGNLKTEIENFLLDINKPESIDIDGETLNLGSDGYYTKPEMSFEFEDQYMKVTNMVTLGNYSDAQTEGNTLLSLAVSDYEKTAANATQGAIEYSLGNLQLSQKHASSAIAIDPTYAYAHEILSYTSMAQNNWRLAEESARKVLELEPGMANSHYLLALALYGAYKDTEAIVELQKAIELSPDDQTYKDLLNSWQTEI